jgi:hypothetical protein
MLKLSVYTWVRYLHAGMSLVRNQYLNASLLFRPRREMKTLRTGVKYGEQAIVPKFFEAVKSFFFWGVSKWS